MSRFNNINRNENTQIRLRIGFGKKSTIYEGDIYSPEFVKAVSVVLEKYYGKPLPKEIQKLLVSDGV